MTGDEMRAIRESLGLTQAELADALGIYGQSFVGKMERGDKPITDRTATALASIVVITALVRRLDECPVNLRYAKAAAWDNWIGPVAHTAGGETYGIGGVS